MGLAIAKQIVERYRGTIAIHSILHKGTIVTVVEGRVALIPHTLANTTLGFRPPGATVNLETDLLAKYVAKAVQAFSHSPTG